MWTLALACAFFLCIHLMVSGTTLKDQIIGGIGKIAYYLLFALFSVVGLIWMSVAFVVALNNHDGFNHTFWTAPLFLRILALPANFIAFLLIVLGVLTPSATNLLSLHKLPEKPVYGVVRISRHPVLAGIGLWATIHLICNGNLASWVYFGSLLAVCALGANNIDRKREAIFGESYRTFKKRTSIVPFVAIIEGRTAFIPDELGYAKMFLAAATFAVFAVLHELLFGIRAL